MNTVRIMSHHAELPGEVPAAGPDPTLEWVRPDVGVAGALSARLGSDPRGDELLLAVLRVLRPTWPRDSWEAVVDELPFRIRAMLRSDATAGTPRPRGRDAVDAVARAILQPAARARFEIGAVFGSLKEVLPRGLTDALAHELPDEMADLWRDAR